MNKKKNYFFIQMTKTKKKKKKKNVAHGDTCPECILPDLNLVFQLPFACVHGFHFKFVSFRNFNMYLVILIMAVFTCYWLIKLAQQLRQIVSVQLWLRSLGRPTPSWILGDLYTLLYHYWFNNFSINESYFAGLCQINCLYGHLPIVPLYTHPTRPFVLLFDRDLAKSYLTSECTDRTVFTSFLTSFLGNGLLTISGQRWLSKRRLLSHTFHSKLVQTFAVKFNLMAKELVNELKGVGKLENTTKAVYDQEEWIEIDNLMEPMSEFSMKVLLETIVGIDSKIHRGFCARFAKEGEQLVGFVYERSLCPWLWPDSVFAFTRQGTKEKQFVDFAQQFARHLIQQKRKENIKVGGRLKAFCDHLVQLLINRKLSEAEVIDEINTFLAAGHHTTSITLTFTIWLLANHSNVLRQLQQEVDDHFKTIEQEPNHVQRLPFLDAVLRESLRLYPPIPAVGRWNGRNFSQTVNGRSYRIPKGVNVVVPIYFLHRNPIFYERPNTFDPNRFLNSDRVADKSWLAFSFGARNCIGYRFAMTQLKITLAHLCRHFDFRVSVHQKFTLGMSISITTSDPIRVQFKSRVCRRSKESHQSQ